MNRKTTQNEVKRFKKAVNKYIDLFGLHDWAVYVKVDNIGDNYGQISRDMESCTAKITLCSELDPKSAVDMDIESTAKHEVIHLLLSRLVALAESRYLSPEEIYTEEERVCNILEKVIP